MLNHLIKPIKLLCVTFILFFSCSHFLNAALPPLNETQLKNYSDVIVEGQVLKIEKERKGTGFLKNRLVKDHYVITIGKLKVIKSLKQIELKELKIMGESVIKRPGVGPIGHLGIGSLKVGDTFRAYCTNVKDQGLVLKSPNGIKMLKKVTDK